MPIHEYKCNECGEIYEVIMSSCDDANDVSASTHPKCPACQGKGIKQISASSFRINGYSEKNGYS